eukprot:TRINITY_DN1559_c0_g1_i1.p1 TRINITY_DN1559_c0_g1~~TRINITY_DN1559_c0_g1_i1.p1  ORF type:complete len:538 (-),score=93.45 TRINITY_DN1559_c0_g1_i1:148-1761(-)
MCCSIREVTFIVASCLALCVFTPQLQKLVAIVGAGSRVKGSCDQVRRTVRRQPSCWRQADLSQVQATWQQDAFRQAVPELFYRSLKALCDSKLVSSVLTSGNLLVRTGEGEAYEYKGVKRLFWALYRKQRDMDSDRRNSDFVHNVKIRSSLGNERSVSVEELADLVVQESCRAPSAGSEDQASAAMLSDWAADIRATKGGAIRVISRAWMVEQGSHGQLLCPRCGCFCAGQRGLREHLLRAHGSSNYMAQDTITSRVREFPLISHAHAMMLGAACVHAAASTAPSEATRRPDATLCEGMAAARDGDLDKLRTLIEHGGWDPKTRDKNGCPALLWAAGNGHLDVCQYLVNSCGLDPNTPAESSNKGFAGRSALHWAARNGQDAVVQWLVNSAHVYLDAGTKDGTVAFHLAAWQGHLSCVGILHGSGCNVHAVNDYGCNAALWASQGKGGLQVLANLHTLGCDFSHVNSNHHSVLHKAAQWGKTAACTWLLKERAALGLGARQLQPDKDGLRPSDWAELEGHAELARMLRAAEGRKLGT